MFKSVLLSLLRFLFVSLPRFLLGVLLFIFSIISGYVGKIGEFSLLRGLPYLPIRVMLSPTEARIVRDDFMRGMDGVAEELIDQHYGESHARELTADKLRYRLNHGEFQSREKFHTGEFGVSLLLTYATIAVILFDVAPGRAKLLSLGIAAVTLVLLFAISTRTLLFDLLSYEEAAGASLVENTKRMAWNGAFLSHLHAFPYLLLLKSVSVQPSTYRLTIYALGVGTERAIAESVSLTSVFIQIFSRELQEFWAHGEFSDDVPPAEAFTYISR